MKEQATEAILKTAAEFVNRESNRQSLITVTKVEVDERGVHCSIFVSVFPDEQAGTALEFLNRRIDDFKLYLRKRVKMRPVQHITFVQDPNIGGLVVGEDPKVA